MSFTVRPLLQNLPRNSSFVRCVGYSYGIEPNIDRFGDPKTKVFERECHLGECLAAEMLRELFDMAYARVSYFSARDLNQRAESYVGVGGHGRPAALGRFQLIHYIVVE